MPDIISFSRPTGLSLLACSALVRILAVMLLLAALWGAIHWADAFA